MKLGFFTYDFPYPTTSGGKTRAYNFLKYAGSGIEFVLFSFTREPISNDRLSEVKKLGASEIYLFPRRNARDFRNLTTFISTDSIFRTLYYDRYVEDVFSEAVKKHALRVVHFESYYTGFYLSDSLKDLGIKQVFGTENIESQVYETLAERKNILIKLLLERQVTKIRREEERMIKQSDLCLAVTDEEAKYVEKFNKNLEVVPNGVDLSVFHFRPKRKEKNRHILFIGNFTYVPNLEAITFLYRDIFEHVPYEKVELVIVGKDSTKLPFANSPQVKTYEFVSDIVPIYHEADIFVSPVKIGGGTNYKVLEAMATGVPVISYPDRVEELGAKDGEHALFANNAYEFVGAIKRIFEDEALVEKLTKNARKLIEEKYNWKKIGEKLNKVWKGLGEM